MSDREHRPKVLVVDDEPMIRKVISWTLQRRGYDVLVASDGEDGLTCYQDHPGIDLVLSDIVMPRLDGVGMVQALRERDPAVPVLFMSGYTGHDRPTLTDDDLRRLLDKPFTPAQLVARIEEVLAAAPA